MKRSTKSACQFEQLVALHVEEDLSAGDRSRVEAHLRECSDCWDLAEDLKESQSVFKAIREDVPSAAELSAVRERVLSEVGGVKSNWWLGRLVFACLALAVVGIGAWKLTPSSPLEEGGLRPAASGLMVAAGVVRSSEPPRQTVTTPLVPSARWLSGLATPPQEKGTGSARRNAVQVPVRAAELPAITKEPKQVAIKFLTDDPNIIIYWLVDEKGD